MATVHDVSVVLGISEQAVRKLAKAGVFTHAVQDASKPNEPWDIGPTVEAAADDYRKFKERTDDAGKDWRLEVTKEDARIKRLKADMLQLQFDEAKGKYHRAEFVRDAFNELVYAQRSAMAALPGKLAPRLAGITDTAVIASIIKDEVRAVQDDLANFEYSKDYYRARLVEAGGFAVKDDE